MRQLLVLVLALCCSPVFAGLPETPQFRQFTVADGLPSSTLYGITQDKKGFIWIASKDGLARYDGVGYDIYRYAPGDDNALPGNVVQALHVDSQGQLWVAIEGKGVSRLNAERTEFTHYRKSTRPEMGSDDIWSITSTPDGNMWFGSFGGGLHRLDKQGRMKRFMPDKNDNNSLVSETVLSLVADVRGQLWVGTTKGLCVWDGKKFTAIAGNTLLQGYIMQLLSDADGSVWAGTNKGLLHLSQSGKQIGAALLPEEPITGLWQDRQGAIWFSNGPDVLQWRHGQLLRYTPDRQLPAKIYGVFEDHEGGIWLPTEDRGILRLPAGWRNFSIFRSEPENKTTMSGMVMHAAVQADANHAWLVSQGGGLDKINLTNGRVDWVLTDTQKWTSRLWSVLQTRDGAVWIGHSNGMTRFNPATRELKHFKSGSGAQETLPGAVRLLVQTPDGLLWSASYGGGIQARNEAGHIVHRIVPGDGKGLASADPDQLSVSPDGQLWVATAQGLLLWDDDAEKFVPIDGDSHERVDAFSFLSADTVWVHRIDGLEAFQWDGKKLQSLRRVSGDDGMPPVEVGSMLSDRSGNLWLTTTRGLLRYNSLTHEVRMFGERDGLPSQEFDMQPALLTTQGLILAGTSKGLVAFDPVKIHNLSTQSPLVLDGLSVQRGEDQYKFSTHLPSIKLEADDRDLRISLRLLSFADTSTHRYRTILKGYDNDWVDTGALGQRVFSNLPAGNYRLEAKAANADGLWSEPLFLKITVQPPWWKSNWAKVLWLLAAVQILFVIAWLYRYRLKRLHGQRLRDREKEIAEKNSSTKSRFLATLGHEIRTPMTGILGMSELLCASKLDPQQRHRVNSIQTAGQHLLRLVNDVLDLAQIEAGKLNFHDEDFDVKVFLQEVTEFLKPLADVKGLTFNFTVDASTPDFCCGDVGRVRQILLNLGSNAIKFTEQGQVLIRIAGLAPHGLQLRVSDTGPGMSDEQQTRLFQRFEQAEGNHTNRRYGGSGLGLAICQELAYAMKGKIEVNSSLGQGAVFTVELPLKTGAGPNMAMVAHVQRKVRKSTLNILLVEDEPVVAEVLVGLLQAMGHNVTHASNGLQALSDLVVKPFDMALLDLDLPGIDGLELARLVQAQGYTLPLVAITARADAQAEPDSYAAGMKAFVRKPVSQITLQDVLVSVTQ